MKYLYWRFSSCLKFLNKGSLEQRSLVIRQQDGQNYVFRLSRELDGNLFFAIFFLKLYR
jgi:hypothetical protein